MTVLLGPPPELTFDDDACRALDVLAAGGLVPPLRLVSPVTGPEVESDLSSRPHATDRMLRWDRWGWCDPCCERSPLSGETP